MADANEKKDNKGADGEGAQDPNKARIETLEKENAALLKETLSKKEQIRDLEVKRQAEEQDRLKEQNRFKELYEGALPKVKRLEEIEPVLSTMLDQEIGDIPVEKRDLIPNFDKPEQRLSWVKQAKAKGLFAIHDANSGTKPAGTVQSKANSEGTLPEFVSWKSNDPRLTKLTLPEFKTWKQHNQKSSSGVVGWGNA